MKIIVTDSVLIFNVASAKDLFLQGIVHLDNTSLSFKKWVKKLNKPLASLKLAVFIIIALAFVTAIGTIIESKYDAYAAKKLVYDTWYMYGIMGLLVLNLIAVMLDRWPWKKRHASFVLAHIGIIMILVGAFLTMKFGIDGNMRVGIGESNKFVQTAETDLVVYMSFDGDRYSKLLDQEVDFFKKPPTKEKPFLIPTDSGDIQVIEYKKYVLPSKRVVADESGKAGAGLRFQIQNPNVNVVEWLVQSGPGALATHNFGPAQIHLGQAPGKGSGRNEIYLTPSNGVINYSVFQKDSEKPIKKGIAKEGDAFDPGFKMPMQFRILRFHPAAVEDWDLQEAAYPTPLTTSAVKILYNGKEHWCLLNDMIKLFTQKAVYILTYGNRRLNIDFPIKLKKFDVSRYQGSTRAMAYESVVDVPGIDNHVISMNEPLKFKQFTIYQASFTEENGRPNASVFSVNYDPGRFLKYLGSLIMTLGIILLMWFKHLDFKIARKSQKGDG